MQGRGRRPARISPLPLGADTLRAHPDFRIIVLANRPGYPFLGNDFFGAIGDVFGCHAVDNPSLDGELAMLRQYAPTVDPEMLRHLALAFGELRRLGNEGLISCAPPSNAAQPACLDIPSLSAIPIRCASSSTLPDTPSGTRKRALRTSCAMFSISTRSTGPRPSWFGPARIHPSSALAHFSAPQVAGALAKHGIPLGSGPADIRLAPT